MIPECPQCYSKNIIELTVGEYGYMADFYNGKKHHIGYMCKDCQKVFK